MSRTVPSLLLRLEGVALAAAAIAIYVHQDFSWLLLVVLALAPDLSMLGYLAGNRAGALAYDVAHTSALPLALGAAGILTGGELAVEIALIWLTHIGIDRAIGYGLKYPSGFKETHLQRV